ncbi:hypothetical protein QUC31_006240 [Theobroma cacao]
MFQAWMGMPEHDSQHLLALMPEFGVLISILQNHFSSHDQLSICPSSNFDLSSMEIKVMKTKYSSDGYPLYAFLMNQFCNCFRANNGSDFQHIESWLSGKEAHKFYHLNNVSQLRMDDIPKLLAEYKKLLPE